MENVKLTENIVNDLKGYKELLDNGVLTQEEFAKIKADLLNQSATKNVADTNNCSSYPIIIGTGARRVLTIICAVALFAYAILHAILYGDIELIFAIPRGVIIIAFCVINLISESKPQRLRSISIWNLSLVFSFFAIYFIWLFFIYRRVFIVLPAACFAALTALFIYLLIQQVKKQREEKNND